MTENKNKPKGFAAMSPEKRRECARKGGETISKNKLWMQVIGSRGGSITQARKKSKTITQF